MVFSDFSTFCCMDPNETLPTYSLHLLKWNSRSLILTEISIILILFQTLSLKSEIFASKIIKSCIWKVFIMWLWRDFCDQDRWNCVVFIGGVVSIDCVRMWICPKTLLLSFQKKHYLCFSFASNTPRQQILKSFQVHCLRVEDYCKKSQFSSLFLTFINSLCCCRSSCKVFELSQREKIYPKSMKTFKILNESICNIWSFHEKAPLYQKVQWLSLVCHLFTRMELINNFGFKCSSNAFSHSRKHAKILSTDVSMLLVSYK
jgi:hypothetical protein